MTKWTDGPWEVGDLDMNGQRIVVSPHIEICTCWHHSVGAIEKEMEANARLIAAAPDLYEALVEARERMVGNSRPILALIRKTDAALRRARGEDE